MQWQKYEIYLFSFISIWNNANFFYFSLQFRMDNNFTAFFYFYNLHLQQNLSFFRFENIPTLSFHFSMCMLHIHASNFFNNILYIDLLRRTPIFQNHAINLYKIILHMMIRFSKNKFLNQILILPSPSNLFWWYSPLYWSLLAKFSSPNPYFIPLMNYPLYLSPFLVIYTPLP